MCKERYLTPLCCDAAKTRRPIYLHWEIDHEDNFAPKPVWALRMEPTHDELRNYPVAKILPKFCPFCGTGLPEVEKNPKPPKKVCVITDGGYYCDTCRKRLMECECFSPEFAWRVKKISSISGSGMDPAPEMEE